MKKKRQEDWTDEENAANIAEILERAKKGIRSQEELERDAYFNDPANAKEVEEMMARMDQEKAEEP